MRPNALFCPRFRRLRVSTRLLVGASLGATAVVGAPAAADPAPAAAEPASVPERAETRDRAEIVLIADVGADRELALLLRELLGRRGVDAEIARADRFEPNALFAAGERTPLRIFIAERAGREARLYFRAPGGERYLVRRLTLPSGLDAVGRELVGQVVESSTGALLDSSQGVSREQASREIAHDDPTTERVAPPPTPPSRVRAREPEQPERARASWEPHVAARYAVAWLGADLGARHGPGVALGVRRVGSVLAGVEVTGERSFEQTFAVPGLEGRVQASTLGLMAELGLSLGQDGRLVLGAGPRLELTAVHVAATAPDVTPAASNTHPGAGLRFALGYEWGFGHVALGASAVGDVAFERTHYDLVLESSGPRRIAEAPSWRPGAALSLIVR
jgi:hypothetical protein